MPADPAIEAAARAVLVEQYGLGDAFASRIMAEEAAGAAWSSVVHSRRLATAAIRAYLAAQPAERTAAEMRREVDTP